MKLSKIALVNMTLLLTYNTGVKCQHVYSQYCICRLMLFNAHYNATYGKEQKGP